MHTASSDGYAMVGSMYYMDQAWNSLMIQITENEHRRLVRHICTMQVAVLADCLPHSQRTERAASCSRIASCVASSNQLKLVVCAFVRCVCALTLLCLQKSAWKHNQRIKGTDNLQQRELKSQKKDPVQNDACKSPLSWLWCTQIQSHPTQFSFSIIPFTHSNIQARN